MNVLGIRCSNKDFAIAVMSGSKKKPQLIDAELTAFPKGYKKPQSLKWFHQEVTGIVKKHGIKKIVFRANESFRANKRYEDRVEHEAAGILAGTDQGLNAIFKKRRNTIAKDLGLKGRANYLAKLDTSVIPDFGDYHAKIQDAILSAWSELN